jgi:hypothetical protein
MTARLFTIDGGSLDFDASVPCIIATYTGFVLSEDFRSQCEEGLIQIRKKVAEHGKVAWITNLTNSDIFCDEDVNWVLEYWNTNAYAGGLVYYAVVVPENIFTTINLNEYMEAHRQCKNPLVLNLFQDVESALGWLREVMQ